MIEQSVLARLKISPSLRFSLKSMPSSETIATAPSAIGSGTGEARETMGRRKIAKAVAENFILMSEFGVIS
jgi:hypothetical protein